MFAHRLFTATKPGNEAGFNQVQHRLIPTAGKAAEGEHFFFWFPSSCLGTSFYAKLSFAAR